MGWLWGSGDAAPSKASKESAYVAPDRTKRVVCWDSRDDYFQCLNRNSILDAIKESDAAAKACGKESEAFEANCASSWVSTKLFYSALDPMSGCQNSKYPTPGPKNGFPLSYAFRPLLAKTIGGLHV